jgi:hypothetical protein
MRPTAQARLDDEDRRNLKHLTRILGLSSSEVIRVALRRLAAAHPPAGRPRIAGLGQFASAVSDLGSNKKHLKGFGR